LSAAVGGSGQKWGNTYGLSPQFLESLWINGPLVTRVFVANVSRVTTSSALFLKMTMAIRNTSAFCHSNVCLHSCSLERETSKIWPVCIFLYDYACKFEQCKGI
jgi:hypothetical protein